jgi:alkyl hydroperoxide reductase subunit F
MSKQVRIYSTATCAYCHAEKSFLKDHNVDFQDIRVDEDQAAAEEMIKISGQMGVPFTVISEEGKDPEYILGFDQPRLTTALGL